MRLAERSLAPYVTLYFVLLGVSIAPIAQESVPPLFDYPNHLGRMYLLASHSIFYAASWGFLPNLAMDATVVALAPFMPIEAAGQVFLVLTIALLAASVIALHYQVHGELTAWPYAVFIFTYNRILLWGFVNYIFGIGLAFLGLALWLRIRHHLSVSRVLAFHGLAVAVFLAHLAAFGVFAMSVAALELRRPVRARRMLFAACAMAVPVVLFVVTKASQSASHNFQIGSPHIKAIALAGTFRAYEPSVDGAVVMVLAAGVAVLVFRGRVHVSRTLTWPILSLAVFYAVTPQFVFNSETTRLSLPLVLFAMAATRVEGPRWVNGLAMFLIVVLTLVKTGTVMHTWSSVAPARSGYVELVDRVPAGAKLFTVVFHERNRWSPLPEALEHLCALAVRRGVFVAAMFVSPYTHQPLVIRPEYRSLYRSGPEHSLSTPPDWPRVGRDYDYLLVARGQEALDYEVVGSIGGAVLYRLRSQQVERW